jgi:hypothetical protein
MMRVAKWIMPLLAILCLKVMGQEVLVLNDASTANGIACLQPPPPTPLPGGFTLTACPVAGNQYHLVQGQRTELRVFNRKFLTDYSITIDAVTQIQSGPNIRNLNEAENLTLGAASFASIPLTKGGTEVLTPRTATQVLLQLADETTSTQPQTDLASDLEVIERENAKLLAQTEDFAQSYHLLRGLAPRSPLQDCQAVIGSPSVGPLRICLDDELNAETGGIANEAGFLSANTRVHDLVGAVKKLGDQLVGTDLPGKLRTVDGAVAQYDNDVLTFRGNVRAADDAVYLALTMNDGFRKKLRRQEMKVLLLDKLKGADSKPTLDEAEMNEVLDAFESSHKDGRLMADDNAIELQDFLPSNQATQHAHNADHFRDVLSEFRFQMNSELPYAINELNLSQAKLLNRINYIYDHSQVSEPLPKQIDLSGHSGNLVVYYTIRRIETFQRYTVAQVQGPGSGPSASLAGTPLPPAKGAAAGAGAQPNATTGNPAASPSQANATANGSPSGAQASADANQGIVVAKGSFEVHDVFHANVVAAIAFSTLKDQSITKQAQPTSCTGTPTAPDSNCFAPLLNSNSYKWAPIVGLDYYLHPRDTFPRAQGQRWECTEDWKQCVGFMGAASAVKANNYFIGGFFEPKLGVQFAAGANFGTKTVLDSNYKLGTPVDITGDFPTHDARGTGFFLSAGLDLGIFRKIFGKFTGIGTAASGTSGK